MYTRHFKSRIKWKVASIGEYVGLVLGLILLGLSDLATGATYYVAQNSASPTPPYAGWSTAATNIQDAINAAGNGDQVLVTNGTYGFGGLAMAGTLTNRVALNKALTVQSVNGPWVTFILGAGATNGVNAVRCAWLTNGATLTGFTLTAGATALTGAPNNSGGGVWCASTNSIVANCVIVANTSQADGGGAYEGDLQNCLIASNSCAELGGGGVAYSDLTSCTVVYNAGYGVWNANCTNSIIYYSGSSDHQGTGNLVYCCTTSPTGGPGNISAAPQLFADGVHLLPGSPCIGAGDGAYLVTGTDLFGQAWNVTRPPSIGCAEWTPAPVVTTPQFQLQGNPPGFVLKNVAVTGQTPLYFSWLQNGVPLSDNGHFAGSQTTNLVASGVIGSDAASYQLVVSNAVGVVTSSVANLVIHFVATSGGNPISPYTSWATAATNIQSAITAAAAGDVVLVTNGVYATGGISIDGVITNRVSVNKAILVQSVSGPALTLIQGAWDPTSTNGPGAVRCAWLTNSAILGGFTLQGGATRSGSGLASTEGGGIYASSTNAWAYNCVIAANAAGYIGGGVYKGSLFHCTLAGNQATSYGGGADSANLENCLITGNVTVQSYGGGTASCQATNCAYLLNSSTYSGGAAYSGTLVNCTVTENTSSGYSSGYGGAVAGATLANCIVYGNFSRTAYPNTNYNNCTLTYCDSDPLPTGTGNIDVNPQLLADGIHLAATSPCIGAGTATVVSGTDIDSQSWSNPPSIGCDEWQPAPVIAIQPALQINNPWEGLTFSTLVAGLAPITYAWSLNGSPLQDDGHHSNSGTASLTVNHFGPGDAGIYQVVVSNSVGVVTSQVATVVMHVVNAGGISPSAPYATWATAATNIQDAINVAAAGDIVLVTNGVYAAGGAVEAGTLTNRVALTLPITVISANGFATTTIQGTWDPVTTNGPGAVRCAWVGDGAQLIGFTLENGATRAAGDLNPGGVLESGGGVCCHSSSGIVANCLLTNNCAVYGGGINSGTMNNSLVEFNQAYGSGAGAYYANLNNCTVLNNAINTPHASPINGAGTYYGIVNNSIVLNNYDNAPGPVGIEAVPDNFYPPYPTAQYAYSCAAPSQGQSSLVGSGNLNVNPSFLDFYHLATNSPCRGKGRALYTSGFDLEGQPWANPPSMGCSEVVVSNLVGPLSVNLLAYQTNVLVNRGAFYGLTYTGRAATTSVSFGDGHALANAGLSVVHIYTNAGNYIVTYTVYNNDNPAGVSTNTLLTVLPLPVPQLQGAVVLTNGFQFQFPGTAGLEYTIQYTTNLAPPVVWNTLTSIFYSSSAMQQITDPATATGTRFYRVLAQ